MFYSYAEKQNSMFYESWHLRQIAFDTTRRYFYYSESIPSHLLPRLERNITRKDYDAVETQHENMKTGLSPKELTYRKKYKIFGIKSVATFHQFEREDPYVGEKDMFQLEIYGEARTMVKGEAPPIEPCLCPSASPIDDWSRYSYANDAHIKDPFFINELYDSLRAQFEEIEREKMRAKARAQAEGRTLSAADTQLMTIASPHTQSLKDVYSGIRQSKIVIRCRDERDFRRLWYVIQVVLGYDKLTMRPYRGLPPYDPRNGLSFALVPMHTYMVFAEFDKTVFYTFIRGNVLGTNAQNELEVNLRGVYMAVTHDMLYFLRDSGNIPRWVRLQEINRFEYNFKCQHPFCAFYTDRPAPDILFVPQPPSFGEEAIRNYDPRNDVKRILHVLHTLCFGSLIVRRVFDIVEVDDASPRSYHARVCAEGRAPLLHPVPGYAGALNCPLPKEQLAQVWRQVHTHLRRQMAIANSAAIPIYRETALDRGLSTDNLSDLERHLERERASENEIVGISIDRIAELHMAAAAAGAAATTTSAPSADGSAGAATTTDRLEASSTGFASASSPTGPAPGGPVMHRFPTVDSVADPPSLCSSYAVSGNRYYTASEALGMSAPAIDHHHIVCSPTGAAPQSPAQHMMAASAAAFATSLAAPQFQPGANHFCQSVKDVSAGNECNMNELVAESLQAMDAAGQGSDDEVAT